MLFANSPKCPKSSFPTQTLHLGPLFANSPRGHQLQCPAERHGHGHPDHVVPGLGSAERGRSAALGRRDHIQRRASVTDACSHLGRRKILDRFRGQMRSWQVLGEHAGPVKHCFIGVVCVCVCSWPGVFGYVSPPPHIGSQAISACGRSERWEEALELLRHLDESESKRRKRRPSGVGGRTSEAYKEPK